MRYTLTVIMCLVSLNLFSQEKLSYQKPPQEIIELVDVQPAPLVQTDNAGEYMVLFYRNSFKTIAELSEKELRLAGLRINPKNNIGSRTTFYINLKVKKLPDKSEKQVTGLPENARLANFEWSPNQRMIAFTNATDKGVELWLLDIQTAIAKKLSTANLNANMPNPFCWFEDNNALLVKFLPSNRPDLINTDEAVPGGPTITVSSGEKAQNRTYQDLLKNRNDEQNYELLVTSELYKVSLDGEKTIWKEKAMYSSVSFSPDGNYVMITTIQKPFSYIVPYYRFPQKTSIYKNNGDFVKIVNEVPLTEVLPKGFMAERKGRREMEWRSDKPAALFWVEALDEGDPEKKVPNRDELFQLNAPFNGTPISLFKTINRYSHIQWGNDNIAIVHDYWWNNRNTKSYLINPSNAKLPATTLFDRNYQDRYSDPGNFITRMNNFGRYVLAIEKGNAFLIGDGYSKEGQFPFIDKINLKNKQKFRMYQSEFKNKLEDIIQVLDISKGNFLVRIEAATEYPNYYIRNINGKNELQQITFFENPFISIQNIHKEVITYKRDDGLDLTGTLYLPVGYDVNKKEKLPMIIWAYPVEYKDKGSAGQNTLNPNEFTYPSYRSMIFWVTRGYVVLDDASFPIVGEESEEPNDSFVKQLVANGKAAIDAVDKMGYIDRDRVAVAGHSYGAFMTANLLSHSHLFAAGIARSGAYNRTLTPFGFQSEERSYWEAPEIYYNMSPFMHADSMKTPLLLIHGEADNNSGTYPLQSERYFNALKGLGATARLVILPKESHGYQAKESILHLLWEQDQWLEKYVKNREKNDK